MMDISAIIFDPLKALLSKPSLLLPMIMFILVFTFVLVGLVFGSVQNPAIGLPVHVPVSTGGLSTIVLVLALIVIIAALLIVPLLNGIYIVLSSQLRTGKQLSLNAAIARSKQKYMSLLGADFLAGLIEIAVIGGLYAIGYGILLLSLGILGILLLLIVVLLMIAALFTLTIIFFQINAVIIIEDKRAVEGIKRSIEIGKKNPWSIIGTVLLLIVLDFVLSLVLGFIVEILSLPFMLAGVLAVMVIYLILTGIIDGVLAAWFAMVPGTFYYSYVAKQPAAPAAAPAAAKTPPSAAAKPQTPATPQKK